MYRRALPTVRSTEATLRACEQAIGKSFSMDGAQNFYALSLGEHIHIYALLRKLIYVYFAGI